MGKKGRVTIGNVMEISAMREKITSVGLTRGIINHGLTFVPYVSFFIARYFTSGRHESTRGRVGEGD